jgi:hypothetical protein
MSAHHSAYLLGQVIGALSDEQPALAVRFMDEVNIRDVAGVRRGLEAWQLGLRVALPVEKK